MSDERERTEIQALKGLIEHPGWIVFQRDAKEQHDALQASTLDSIKTIEDLAYRKGVVDTLKVIVNYENVIAAAEENLANASDDV
jgi:hypothetical protein